MNRIRDYIKFIENNNKIIKILAVIAIIITALLFYSMKDKNDTIKISEAEIGNENETSQSKSEINRKKEDHKFIYVDIGGCVKKPGVYKMESGNRIFEAIEKAGGLSEKADVSILNQAIEIKDGEKIYIPKLGETDRGNKSHYNNGLNNPGNTGDINVGKDGYININLANSEELQKIKGIGPSTAEKIIEYRESNGNFRRIEDLKKIKGIGDKTFNKIKKYVTI